MIVACRALAAPPCHRRRGPTAGRAVGHAFVCMREAGEAEAAYAYARLRPWPSLSF